MNPQLVMRNIIPVVMAGVLGIYGLIVAVIIQGSSKNTHYLLYTVLYLTLYHICMHLLVPTPDATGATKYSSFTGYAHLSAGLCCGLRYIHIDSYIM